LAEKKAKIGALKGAKRVIFSNIVQFQSVQVPRAVVQILHLNDRDRYHFSKVTARPEENHPEPGEKWLTRTLRKLSLSRTQRI